MFGRLISIFYGQATKGVRWMPRQREAMKDAVNCEKPRGAVKQALIRGCPNGETRLNDLQAPAAEFIGSTEGTRGTETS